MDGTNKAAERVIAWWVKEQDQTAVKVSQLLAWAGDQMEQGRLGTDLSLVVA